MPGPKRFRPFGGGGLLGPHLLSRSAVGYLVAHGYTCALWNCVPRDWVEPSTWAARALSDCAVTDCLPRGGSSPSGTAWRNDPVTGLTGILLTQRTMTSPEPPEVARDFWSAAYAAIAG